MKQFLKTMIMITNAWTLVQAQKCPTPIGIFPNPDDLTCGSFLNCAWGIPYVTKCGPGLVFNPKGKYCDWPANYKCPSAGETTPSPPSICVDPFGYYANPSDSNCQRYKSKNIRKFPLCSRPFLYIECNSDFFTNPTVRRM